MFYLFVFISSSLFVAGIIYLLKKPFYLLSVSSIKQLDIILNTNISESEKDKLILKNLLSLLKYFNLIILLFVLVFILSSSPVYLLLNINKSVNADFTSLYFYVAILMGSFPIMLFKKKNDYPYWSRLLHTIILDNYNFEKFTPNKYEIGDI